MILRLVASVALIAATAPAAAFDDWTPQASPAKEAAAHLKAGRNAEAVPLLRAHLDATPADADGWAQLGYAHRKTGDFAASRAAYDKALAVDPDNLNANAYLGALFYRLGDADGLTRQRATMARLCPSGCAARDALDAEIAGTDKTPW